ncbi:GNAT family N-acetyltransferase [Micromonospora peucetia]|nr:GNAT family N-acetyltransferase [Micromonospora peucetia]WSA32725.1 GNAT family N-acetyltransferase [Micromonospora peucetia]
MKMIMRDRCPADLDRCVEALAVVHHTDGYPLNWPVDPHGWLSPAGLLHAWIAEDPGGTLAGHLAVDRVTGPCPMEAVTVSTSADPPTSRPAAEVSRLFVVPAYRRQAVGRRLLKQAQQWAGSRGLALILEVVDDGRSGAVATYEATGWQLNHLSQADWTGPGGEPVRLRHYRYPSQDDSGVTTADGERAGGMR